MCIPFEHPLTQNKNMDIKNCDCMDLMAQYPDKYFDLAIVDPPYGLKISSNPVRQMHDKKEWDNSIPNKDYFNELFRVSKNQVIWGGNYFSLPASQCFLIWDKKQPEDFSLAMCELAWTSFKSPAKIWSYSIHNEKNKIHPTQKPVQLYKWILYKYAKINDKILDTHLGSGSIALACHEMGYDLTACEIDTDYFNAANRRLFDFKKQLVLL